MVVVWTGRIEKGGQTEVNTTVTQASTAIGKVLAPTMRLVYGHKSFMGDARFKQFKPINDKEYQEQYIKLIQDRYLPNQNLFRALLERDEITITCFCGKDKQYCHRFIIVNYILPKCAEHFGIPYSYKGER
jgi:Active DUF488-N3 subclade